MTAPEAAVRDQLTAFCRRHELLRAGGRLGVAVSGGADSVALLRLLLEVRAELGLVLSVVHFDHRIRGEASAADAEFVRALAAEHGLPFHLGSEDVPRRARELRLSLETAARQLRYDYFHGLISSGELTRIATAHTLDDQAETVLQRLIRGAGTRGLAGIYPRLPEPEAGASQSCPPQIIRPLLAVLRSEVERYLRSLGQPWREDASNQDLHHSRNRVRHRLLPLLEQEFNPSIRKVLADTAEIARAEESHWQQQLAAAPSILLSTDRAPGVIDLDGLLALPLALRRRALRQMLEGLTLSADSAAVEALLHLAELPNGSRLELPGQWLARRASHELDSSAAAPVRPRAEWLAAGGLRIPVLLLSPGAAATDSGDFRYPLPIPGSVIIPELKVTFTATAIPLTGDPAAYNQRVLSACHLGTVLEVRNWRPGDRFHPGLSQSVRKVKELLQAKRITGPERAGWPVVVSPLGELLWMRGFPVPVAFAPTADAAEGILVEEKAL